MQDYIEGSIDQKNFRELNRLLLYPGPLYLQILRRYWLFYQSVL